MTVKVKSTKQFSRIKKAEPVVIHLVEKGRRSGVEKACRLIGNKNGLSGRTVFTFIPPREDGRGIPKGMMVVSAAGCTDALSMCFEAANVPYTLAVLVPTTRDHNGRIESYTTEGFVTDGKSFCRVVYELTERAFHVTLYQFTEDGLQQRTKKYSNLGEMPEDLRRALSPQINEIDRAIRS